MFGYIVSASILMILGSVIQGLLLTQLWEWFIVTTFQLPELNVPSALGVSLVVSYLTYQKSSSENKESPGYPKGVFEAFFLDVIHLMFVAGMFLLMGWIVHLYM